MKVIGQILAVFLSSMLLFCKAPTELNQKQSATNDSLIYKWQASLLKSLEKDINIQKQKHDTIYTKLFVQEQSNLKDINSCKIHLADFIADKIRESKEVFFLQRIISGEEIQTEIFLLTHEQNGYFKYKSEKNKGYQKHVGDNSELERLKMLFLNTEDKQCESYDINLTILSHFERKNNSILVSSKVLPIICSSEINKLMSFW